VLRARPAETTSLSQASRRLEELQRELHSQSWLDAGAAIARKRGNAMDIMIGAFFTGFAIGAVYVALMLAIVMYGGGSPGCAMLAIAGFALYLVGALGIVPALSIGGIVGMAAGWRWFMKRQGG
jgi:predicted PurR-regulated permease PerM